MFGQETVQTTDQSIVDNIADYWEVLAKMTNSPEGSAIVRQLAIGQARTETKLDEILRRLDKLEDLETKVDKRIEDHRSEVDAEIERHRSELELIKNRINMMSGAIAVLAFLAPVLLKKLGF